MTGIPQFVDHKAGGAGAKAVLRLLQHGDGRRDKQLEWSGGLMRRGIVHQAQRFFTGLRDQLMYQHVHKGGRRVMGPAVTGFQVFLGKAVPFED